MERVRDVVLDEVSGAPARHVQHPVVDRQVDVGDERRNGPEPLQERRQHLGFGWLGWDGDHLLDPPLLAVEVPQPDGRREVFDRDDDSDEAVGASRIVRGPKLEHHLVLIAEVELLDVLAFAEIPDVHRVAVLASEELLGHHAVLDHRGRSPLAGDERVVADVPPEVVRVPLRATLDLPGTERVERLAVEQEDPTGLIRPVRPTERGGVDRVRTAVERVRPRVAGLVDQLVRLDRAYELRLERVRLRVQHVDPGRAKPGQE